MNKAKLILDAVLNRKDRQNKAKLLAMAINGTYVEDVAYKDDTIVFIYSSSDGKIISGKKKMQDVVEIINKQSASLTMFLTEQQASKISITPGNPVVTKIVDQDMQDSINMAKRYISVPNDTVAVVTIEGPYIDDAIDFTYDGKKYTLRLASTNHIEEPTAPVFSCLNYLGANDYVNSQFELGDDVYINMEAHQSSPYLIFLTNELYSKFQVTAERADGASEQEYAGCMYCFTPLPISLLGADLPFQVPQDAAYFFPFVDGMIGLTTDEQIMSSVTFTYDGVDYVYTSDKITITNPGI